MVALILKKVDQTNVQRVSMNRHKRNFPYYQDTIFDFTDKCTYILFLIKSTMMHWEGISRFLILLLIFSSLLWV